MRKQVEEELRENKDKVQAIVDAFEGLIYICSEDYRIQFMNKGFHRSDWPQHSRRVLLYSLAWQRIRLPSL